MHELALTESMVAAITERLGDARVLRVRLEVGRLTAVLPDALRFASRRARSERRSKERSSRSTGSPRAAAVASCGREAALDGVVALCACGSADVELLAGRELNIKEVEVG